MKFFQISALGLAAALLTSACTFGQIPEDYSPTGPTSASLTVTPSGHQVWTHTDPCFTASGATGEYRWNLKRGYGSFDPPSGNGSKVCFLAAYAYMEFEITVTSGRENVTVSGVVANLP